MRKKPTARKRGFGTLVRTDPARQRELASKGGRTTFAKGKLKCWTPEEARENASLGGFIASEARREKKRLKEEAEKRRAAREAAGLLTEPASTPTTREE